MRGDTQRKAQAEYCATINPILHPDAAPVSFDDRARDGQPHAQALDLGREKRFEDLRQLIEFLKHHGVAEFDVDRGDLKLRLKFNPPEGGPSSLSELAGLLRSSAPPATAPSRP